MRRLSAYRVASPVPGATLTLWLLSMLVAAPGASIDASGSTADQPQYLVFQLFTGGPIKSTGVFTSGNDKRFYETLAKKIGKSIGEKSTSLRKLGFAIGPMALDQSDRETKRLIRDSFEIGLENDLAIAFHLDDYMFWRNAKDASGRALIANSDNIEWKDWSGTKSVNLKIGWLKGVDKLAPQMCYESDGIKKAVRARARLIGSEIARGLASLKRSGKEDLFAGVIVGWESNLADGYCSLSKLGFSASRPPADFDREREQILHRHIARWAQGITSQGIDKEKIFTHIAPIPPDDLKKMRASMSVEKLRKIPQSTIFDAHWTAFNDHSNPGFSAYPAEGMFDDIYDALGRQGGPRWAMAEGTNVTLTAGTHTGGAGQSSMDWETYLGRCFNHGAAVVVLFGGFQGMKSSYAKATESKEAMAAYRKFLRGETLEEGPERAISSAAGSSSGGVDQAGFATRMQGLNAKIRAAGARGAMTSEIRKKMQQLNTHARGGDIEKASAVLDELDTLLGR